MAADFIERGDAQEIADRVAESLRREFTSAITTVQVQVGASERTLSAKITSLKAWGVAALLGGQTIAALVGAYAAPHQTTAALHVVMRILS